MFYIIFPLLSVVTHRGWSIKICSNYAFKMFIWWKVALWPVSWFASVCCAYLEVLGFIFLPGKWQSFALRFHRICPWTSAQVVSGATVITHTHLKSHGRTSVFKQCCSRGMAFTSDLCSEGGRDRCFCSAVTLAQPSLSGLNLVFMIFAVWVVCLCLDNSGERDGG